MYMIVMVQNISFGERWIALFNKVKVELNGTFHLSPNEYLFITRMRKHTSCASNSVQKYSICITLSARTSPAAFAPCRVSHVLFLISLILRASIWRLYWKYWTLLCKCECEVQYPTQTECNGMFCHLMINS